MADPTYTAPSPSQMAPSMAPTGTYGVTGPIVAPSSAPATPVVVPQTPGQLIDPVTGVPMTEDRYNQLVQAGYVPEDPNSMAKLTAAVVPNKAPLGKKALALGAGLGNSLLFGIPQAIANLASGHPDTIKRAVVGNDTTGDLAQEYAGGNFIGNVAPIVLSGGAAAIPDASKSILAKALKGAAELQSPTTIAGKALAATGAPVIGRIGQGLAKLGTTGNVAGIALKAGLDAGTQQAIREIGQQDPAAAQHIIAAFGLGAGTGAAVGALGKGLNNAPQILDEAQANANKDFLGGAFGITGKDLKRSLASSSVSENVVDDLVNTAAQTARANGATNVADAKNLFERVGQTYQLANKAYDAAGVVPSQDFLTDALNNPVIGAFISKHGKQGEDWLLDTLQAMDKAGTASEQRALLSKQQIDSFKAFDRGPDPVTGINFPADQGPAATALKGIFDEKVMSIAKASGIDSESLTGLTLDQAKKIYGDLTPIRHALSREAAKVDKTIPSDSGTAINLLLSGAVVGNPLSLLIAGGGGKMIQKAIGKAGNAASAGISGGMADTLGTLATNPAIGSIATKPIIGGQTIGTYAQKVAPAFGRLAGAIGVGGQPTSTYTPPKPQDMMPLQPMPQFGGAQPQNASYTPPQPQVTTDILGNDISNQAFQDSVNQGLQRQWFATTNGSPMYGPPTMQNPRYAQWATGVMGAMTTNGKIDPQKIAPLLFTSKEQADAYKAYASAKQIATSLAQPATGAAGPFYSLTAGLLNPNAKNAAAGIAGAVEKLAGKSAADQVKVYITRNGNMNPAQLWQNVDAIIKQYNPAISELLQGVGQ